MKLLLALVISAQFFLVGPALAKTKPSTATPEEAAAKAEARKKEAAAKAEAKAHPDAPRVRTPGFWERAWVSSGKLWGTTKKVGSTAAHVVTSPFHLGRKKQDAESGWRNLSMSMTIEPTTVKLPQAKSVVVTVSVVNTGTQAAQFEFPNTQRIEVLLKAEDGKVLSKWSEDQKVSEDEGFLVVNAGEKLEYTATISTRDMAEGKTYIIEAYFPTFDELRTSRTVVPTK